MKALVASALQSGAKRASATRTEWDLAGNCLKPVQRELHVRPSPEHRDEARGFVRKVRELFPDATQVSGHDLPHTEAKTIVVNRDSAIPLTLAMTVRCRKCDRCLALRRMSWSLRAAAETQSSRRTWFGTLTLRPDAQVRAVSQARVHLAKQGLDFDALPYGEQFTERHKQITPLITKYLKRVRKESGAQLTYLCVAEHHKSGLPHYHMLVHEHDEIGVKHSTLSKQWLEGFEKWRLVSSRSEATYLTKYLAKSSVARVRASRDYGNGLRP